MTTINLREYYPNIYNEDQFITLPDEVAAVMRRFQLDDEAYRVRTYRHRAYFSLDYVENAEHETMITVLSPADILEQKEDNRRLYAALNKLPEKQRRRIFAKYILGLTYEEIAKIDGSDPTSICKSVKRGLRQLKKFLENL